MASLRMLSMFSSRGSTSNIFGINSRAHLSSDLSKFDPRTEEFKRALNPWHYKEKEPPGIFSSITSKTATMHSIFKLAQTPFDFRPGKISSFFQRKHLENITFLQEYDSHRQMSLGGDLSVGHALLPLGVSFLYKGKPWMKNDSKNKLKLPLDYEDGWVLEAIDISRCDVCYEGFRSFENLNSVHTIIAQKCQYLDDWCLDLISSQVLGLETLDVSGCERISHRGLAALTRLPVLQTLDISDIPDFKTNEGMVACLLLQDYLPNLTIKGVEFPTLPRD